MSADPRPFLIEVRLIIGRADEEAREMTAIECEECDRLLDAAEALARLKVIRAVPRRLGRVA